MTITIVCRYICLASSQLVQYTCVYVNCWNPLFSCCCNDLEEGTTPGAGWCIVYGLTCGRVVLADVCCFEHSSFLLNLYMTHWHCPDTKLQSYVSGRRSRWRKRRWRQPNRRIGPRQAWRGCSHGMLITLTFHSYRCRSYIIVLPKYLFIEVCRIASILFSVIRGCSIRRSGDILCFASFDV